MLKFISLERQREHKSLAMGLSRARMGIGRGRECQSTACESPCREYSSQVRKMPYRLFTHTAHKPSSSPNGPTTEPLKVKERRNRSIPRPQYRRSSCDNRRTSAFITREDHNKFHFFSFLSVLPFFPSLSFFFSDLCLSLKYKHKLIRGAWDYPGSNGPPREVAPKCQRDIRKSAERGWTLH